MICIYHSRDLDGWMSAAIVKHKYPDVALVGWDYGQPIPAVPAGHDIIIMADVCFPKNDMVSLMEHNQVHWLDHHISAIKQMEGYVINGIRDDKFAACELTWKYLFPDDKMPEIVRLLGRYDCFGHKGTSEESKVLEFQYGARSIISNPTEAYNELVDNIYCDNTEMNIWHRGQGIYQYLCSDAKQQYSKRFSIDFDGHKFGAVNTERLNPINFGIDYHQDGYDGFACFWYDKGEWSFSLYNDNGNVDCSEICKKRGGGGHKGASGFRTKDLFNIINNKNNE